MNKYNFREYITKYHLEYSIRLDNDTEVTIKTSRPELIFSREEDIKDISKMKYNNFHEYSVKDKVLYDNIHQRLNFYSKQDYLDNVKVKLVDTEIKQVNDDYPNLKVKTITFIEEEVRETEIKNEQEESFDLRKVEKNE